MASTPKQWTIQEIVDMTVLNTLNTEVYAKITDMKESSIEFAQENVYAMGGKGNVYISGFSHSKRVTGTATAAVFNNDLMGLITGTSVSTGAVTTSMSGDVLTVSSDAATTTYTAIGTEDAEIKGLFELNADGTFGTEYTQTASTVVTGEFTYDSGTKALGFFSGDIADGTEIIVFYDYTSGTGTQTITNDAGTFSATVRLELDAVVQDACSAVEYAAKIIVYKAKLQGSWSLGLAADGDPASLDVSWEGLRRSCSNSTIVDLQIIDPPA
jgi:hypothetical protein